MRTYEDLLANIESLSTSELRSLNRYYLHPLGKRACSSCKKIFVGITENFHVKKHTSSGVSYNVKCARCFNATNRARVMSNRKDAHVFIGTKVSSYASRAKHDNVPFDLSTEYLRDLWDKQNATCYYTGIPISFEKVTIRQKSPAYTTPSLDRMDPVKGYTMGNVVWCAYFINRMKNDLTYPHFIEACERVLQVHKGRS